MDLDLDYNYSFLPLIKTDLALWVEQQSALLKSQDDIT